MCLWAWIFHTDFVAISDYATSTKSDRLFLSWLYVKLIAMHLWLTEVCKTERATWPSLNVVLKNRLLKQLQVPGRYPSMHGLNGFPITSSLLPVRIWFCSPVYVVISLCNLQVYWGHVLSCTTYLSMLFCAVLSCVRSIHVLMWIGIQQVSRETSKTMATFWIMASVLDWQFHGKYTAIPELVVWLQLLCFSRYMWGVLELLKQSLPINTVRKLSKWCTTDNGIYV